MPLSEQGLNRQAVEESRVNQGRAGGEFAARAPLAVAPPDARPGESAGSSPSHPRRWSIFATVAIGVFMATLDGSIVTIALPTLGRALGASLPLVTWVVLAYLLTVTGTLLLLGRLADMIGRRPVYIAGFALLVFGFFYVVMDVRRSAAARRVFLPFNIYGMNALFIFTLSGLVAKMMGFIKLTSDDGSSRSIKTILYAPIRAWPLAPENTSLVFAVLFDLAMFAIAWAMWKKKWFVKV